MVINNEQRLEEEHSLAYPFGNQELPEHYGRYSDLVSRIRDEHQEFISGLSSELKHRWEALDKRRGLSTHEKPVPYIPFWFAEAFPENDGQTHYNIGLANFFLYCYNILYDDALDESNSPKEVSADISLAQVHLTESIKKFGEIVEDEKFKRDLDSLIQEYQVAEKRLEIKRKRLGMEDHDEMIKDYKTMCSLPKASALALAYLHHESTLGKKLKDGHEMASVGITFIDDIIDLGDDLEKGSWTYPLEQIRKKTQIGKDRLFGDVKALYQVSEECLVKGIQYLQKAREIFEGVGCNSFALYLDYVSEGASTEIGAIRKLPINYGIKDTFQKIRQDMQSRGLST